MIFYVKLWYMVNDLCMFDEEERIPKQYEQYLSAPLLFKLVTLSETDRKSSKLGQSNPLIVYKSR